MAAYLLVKPPSHPEHVKCDDPDKKGCPSPQVRGWAWDLQPYPVKNNVSKPHDEPRIKKRNIVRQQL
jgi:hypothetical protein